MGSLSLLQQIFPTQESNRGLLHCRQILYQLSYQGSPPMERFQLNSQSAVSAQQNLMGHRLACSRLVPSLLWPCSLCTVGNNASRLPKLLGFQVALTSGTSGESLETLESGRRGKVRVFLFASALGGSPELAAAASSSQFLFLPGGPLS